MLEKTVRQFFFDNGLSREFFDSFCGEKIGCGISREVYEHRHDKSLVVKIAYACRGFQNIHEWDLWTQLSEGKSAWVKWLAPCTWISDSGSVLFQKKVKPVPYDFILPTSVPRILSDFKRDNYGIYKNRFVCCDYGRHDSVYEGCYPRGKREQLKKAIWLGAEDGHFVEPYVGRGNW